MLFHLAFVLGCLKDEHNMIVINSICNCTTNKLGRVSEEFQKKQIIKCRALLNKTTIVFFIDSMKYKPCLLNFIRRSSFYRVCTRLYYLFLLVKIRPLTEGS